MKFLPALFLSFAPLHAATVLTEADGDLSNDYTAPSEAILALGQNTVTFTIGVMPANGGGTNAIDGPADIDFILFRLPAGASVTEIRVTLVPVPGENRRHFFGGREGTSFPVAPANSGDFIDSLDANFVFGQGSDLAQQFLTDPDEDFISLFQETGNDSAFITLDLTVVPEPSAFLLSFAASFLLLKRRR